MKRYTRLSLAEREEISRHVAAGQPLRAIARQLGRAPSTISRARRRAGTTRTTYRAASAQQPRRWRKLAVHARLRGDVHGTLALRWSLEQMAKRVVAEYPGDAVMRVSHETIDASLYVRPRGALKRELLRALRHRRTQRKPRGAAQDRRGVIPDMIRIEERPADVAARTVPGHWKGDRLLGQRHASALGTLVERTTRTTLLVPLRAKDAPHRAPGLRQRDAYVAPADGAVAHLRSGEGNG